MADSFLVAGVKVSLEKVMSLAVDQIGMVSEFKEDLESLEKTVKMISAVVDHAEVKHPAVNEWLKSLEVLACRAENVLDEVNFEILWGKLDDWHQLSFFSISHNKIAFQLRIARKLKDINNKFELSNKKATALGLQSQLLAPGFANSTAIASLSSARTSREKVSIVGQKVIGRENYEKVLLDKLLSKSDELFLTSIPIIGMGGVGKTTLAQSIYNNKQVLDHFGKRIWIFVPQGIAPMSIFRLILDSLPRDPDENSNRDNIPLDAVVQKIKEKLQDKRYLLVLDNVWSGHSESSWGEFLGSLHGISTGAGNCIVITTREVQVASIFCPRREDHVFLQKLSDEDCLEIVKEKALIHEESIQYFAAMSRNIGKVCQGVPLVARVIGGLLGTNPASDWHSILQDGISNMVGNEYDDIMQVLQLSYGHLHSPSLKKCFTYCSLFEKNCAMDKKQLIQLWMAEGFIQPKPGHDDMKIGSKYINSLIGCSLLEEVIDTKGECNCVRMHDLVHNLAQSISNPVKDLKDLKEEDRHIVIHLFGKETEALPKMKMLMLRTLFVESGTLNSLLLTSFKYLQVLKLSLLKNDKFPSSISKLIHLRYLGVSLCDFKTFPESTSELYNLQTLTIKDCWNIEALPEGMTKLINLRHVDCNDYLSLPPKIGRLTNLQTLSGRFDVSEENQIKELGFLKNLKGSLRMWNLDSVSNKEEAQQADLNRKPMTSLSYLWDKYEDDINSEAVLEGLEPHPHLQDLNIDGFKGTQFPSWFMNMVVCLDQNPSSSHRLDNLVSLSIFSCKYCKQLPALGQLPSLKYLSLAHLPSVICIEPSFYGNFIHHVTARKIFPALRIFQLFYMRNLTEWMGYQTTESTTEEVEIFPNLEELEICYTKLRHAPIHYFHRVKHLNIYQANLNLPTLLMEKDQNCHRFPNSERIPKFIFTSVQS